MHLRNANHSLARLVAGVFTGALVLVAHSALADETSVTPPVSSQTVSLQTPASSNSTSPSTVSASTASTQLSVTEALAQAGFNPDAVSPRPSTKPGSLAPAVDVSATVAPAAEAPRGSFLAGVASKAGDVVVGALNLIGVRYRWGGDTPDSGLDCSGFVRYVFQDTLNFTLPRTAGQMSQVGERVSFNDLKPGDLVFFNTVRRTISHVGIYIGHDKFVHSPSTGSTIRVDEMNDRYWETRFRGARRLSPVAGDGDGDEGTDLATRLQRAANVAY